MILEDALSARGSSDARQVECRVVTDEEFPLVLAAWRSAVRCAPAVLLLALIGTLSPVRAQTSEPVRNPDAFLNQQRSVDDNVRKSFESQTASTGKAAFDWGGWYSLNFFVFDDGVESSRTLRRHDLRLWGRLTLDRGAHEFFVRTRLSFLDFNSGESYDGNDDDVEGPNLERGVYRFDLSKALSAGAAEPSASSDFNLTASAGRDLVEFGTGLTLATPLDHVSLRTTYRDWALTTLAGKTVGSSDDFDLSRTAAHTRRDFLGGEIRYLGWERHQPFAYALWQRDRNRELWHRLYQRFDYDSSYFGLGAVGELTPHVRYETEGVLEEGRGYGHKRFLKTDEIEAWACRAELEYLAPGERKARTSVEYLFAGGDPDRLTSPTNSFGGNRFDFTDNGFIGFGFRDTGLAFAPRYSNLHMWRIGGSFYPWPRDERLRRLELGTDWYLYQKHHASAAVSDPTAHIRSGYLGWEMDYYANWRVTSDLAWTARLGAFFPGDAFADQTTRTFFLLGVTWSF